jgi:uncharacterized protein (TIGR03435 family)
MALPSLMNAQPILQGTTPLSFEVASVKVAADQGPMSVRPEWSPGLFRWTTQLWYLAQYAYHVQPWRLTGQSLGGTIYEVEAKVDPKATEDQVRLMLQSLLMERFGLAAHRVMKDVDGYALTTAKGRFSMLIALEGKIPPLPAWMRPSTDPASVENQIISILPSDADGVGIAGRRVTMLQLTDELQRLMRTSVVDQTGLTGTYYFDFRAPVDNDPDAPYRTLVPAVNQIGLRMEKHRAPVEILVVDHVELIPSGN